MNNADNWIYELSSDVHCVESGGFEQDELAMQYVLETIALHTVSSRFILYSHVGHFILTDCFL